MTSNAEKALSYAMSLAHATAGGGLRRTPEQIIEEAEKYQVFLDAGEGFDDGYLSVWVLTSPTYKAEPHENFATFAERAIVGIYATQEAAESYRDNATPPVTDGVITNWGVHDRIVGPDGQYLPIGAGE